MVVGKQVEDQSTHLPDTINVPGWKDVMLFIVGTTPQIVTETIWALATSTPRICPQEVVIITTSTGRKLIVEMLIKRGIMASLCRDYEIPEFPFDESCIQVPLDHSGEPVCDIRTTDDNVLMGDFISRIVRGYCDQRYTRLHCSLAGGRKTMSFYLGYALQLFGRPQDKLYHVLVPEEFESSPDIFYIPLNNKKNKMHETTVIDNKVDTSGVKIELAELPFLRLREKITVEQDSLRELLQASQNELDIATMQPVLIADLGTRLIRISGHIVELIPVHLMVYAAFLRQKNERCQYPERTFCQECCACFRTISELSGIDVMKEMVRDYHRIYGDDNRAMDLARKWRDGMDQATLRQYITRINKSIAEQLPDESIHHFVLVKPEKRYASSRYGLRLEKSRIRFA